MVTKDLYLSTQIFIISSLSIKLFSMCQTKSDELLFIIFNVSKELLF
ncbi:hypothetical protein [Candidatus Tisiphia endosymbiont of Beris chalybata]